MDSERLGQSDKCGEATAETNPNTQVARPDWILSEDVDSSSVDSFGSSTSSLDRTECKAIVAQLQSRIAAVRRSAHGTIGTIQVQDSSNVTVANDYYNINVFRQPIAASPLENGVPTISSVPHIEANTSPYKTHRTAGEGAPNYQHKENQSSLFNIHRVFQDLSWRHRVLLGLALSGLVAVTTALLMYFSVQSNDELLDVSDLTTSYPPLSKPTSPQPAKDSDNRLLGYRMPLGSEVRLRLVPTCYGHWDARLHIGLCGRCSCSVVRIGGVAGKEIGFERLVTLTNSVTETFYSRINTEYVGPVEVGFCLNQTVLDNFFTFVIRRRAVNPIKSQMEISLDSGQSSQGKSIILSLGPDENVLRWMTEIGNLYFEDANISDGYEMNIDSNIMIEAASTGETTTSIFIGLCNSTNCWSIRIKSFTLNGGDFSYTVLRVNSLNNCIYCAPEEDQGGSSHAFLDGKVSFEVLRPSKDELTVWRSGFNEKSITFQVDPTHKHLKVDSIAACLTLYVAKQYSS